MLGTMDEPEEEIDLVASVGPLDAVVETLRDVLHRSGALRVAAVVDLPEGRPAALVDVGRLAPVEVRIGDRIMHLPHAIELDAAPPGELPAVRQLAPFEVDAAAAQIAAPPGAVAHVAAAVRSLADLLGGRNVAMVQLETSDPAAPLAITARAGRTDPLVLALGEEEFEMDPGWPDPPPAPARD